MPAKRSYTRFPVCVGARDESFEIRQTDGIPFLMENGLPAQTWFDADHRDRISLEGTWGFREDPRDRGVREGWYQARGREEWQPIEVPSVFNSASSGRATLQCPVWYSRTFVVGELPTDGRLLLLRFDGILVRSRVWLNGHSLGGREGGYGSLVLDTAGAIDLRGDNLLVVRVDNRLTSFSLPPKTWKHHRSGWHTYGGIYRDVALESLRSPYIFKVECTPMEESAGATMRVRILVHDHARKGGFEIRCELLDPQGRPIGNAAKPLSGNRAFESATFILPVLEPLRYSPANPALYSVRISAGHGEDRDEVSVLTGIRSVRIQGETLLLNGEPLFLRGICKHEDDPILGATQNASSIARDLDLITGLGANYIRMAHYPHAARESAAARDRGLLLSEEIANYQTGMGFVAWFAEKGKPWTIPLRWLGKRQTMNRRSLLHAQRELAELIERDRNNPAVILWYVGNETWDLFPSGARACAWLREVARALDPTRPVSMAEQTYDKPALDRHRRASTFMDVVSVNLYSGWYYGRIEDAARHLDAVHAAFPGKPMIVSEFGADAAPGRRDEDGEWQGGERVMAGRTYSESYQARLIQEYASIIRDRPFIIGMSPWVFSDFYCSWFPTNPKPFRNLKGIVSEDRVPKEAYATLRRIYREGEAR